MYVELISASVTLKCEDQSKMRWYSKKVRASLYGAMVSNAKVRWYETLKCDSIRCKSGMVLDASVRWSQTLKCDDMRPSSAMV